MTESMRDRFTRVTAALLERNPRLAVVLADIGADRFERIGTTARHPARVINVGIREQLTISVAGGMALEGMRPIAHSYAPFLVERTFEQVKLDFAHQGVGGILVSVGASYDWTGGGRTHQAPGDVALLSTLPGWRIHVPGHAEEVEALLREAVSIDSGVYLRLSEQANSRPMPVPGGRVVRAREGARGGQTVLAVGPMLDRVLEATEGTEATVLYTATVAPLDAAGLRDAVAGEEVVLVEPYLEGTSAGRVAAALSDWPHRLLSIGVPLAEHRHYGTAADHDRALGLDADGIRARIRAWRETALTG